jgi:hypothetical protein
MCDFFPRRVGSDITEPYWDVELQFWRISRRHNAHAVIIITRDLVYPLECLRNPQSPYKDYDELACKVHEESKIYDWHRNHLKNLRKA